MGSIIRQYRRAMASQRCGRVSLRRRLAARLYIVFLITQVAGYLSSSASQSEINAIANANLAVAQSATVTQS